MSNASPAPAEHNEPRDLPEIVRKAREFAIATHGQRKYPLNLIRCYLNSNAVHDEQRDTYVRYLDEVESVVREYGDAPRVVAYMLGILEGTTVTAEQIEAQFGSAIAECAGLLVPVKGDEQRTNNHFRWCGLSASDTSAALIVAAADRLVRFRNCLDNGDAPMNAKYIDGHEQFRDAARRDGLCDNIWGDLDAIVENILTNNRGAMFSQAAEAKPQNPPTTERATYAGYSTWTRGEIKLTEITDDKTADGKYANPCDLWVYRGLRSIPKDVGRARDIAFSTYRGVSVESHARKLDAIDESLCDYGDEPRIVSYLRDSVILGFIGIELVRSEFGDSVVGSVLIATPERGYSQKDKDREIVLLETDVRESILKLRWCDSESAILVFAAHCLRRYDECWRNEDTPGAIKCLKQFPLLVDIARQRGMRHTIWRELDRKSFSVDDAVASAEGLRSLELRVKSLEANIELMAVKVAEAKAAGIDWALVDELLGKTPSKPAGAVQ